MRSAQGAVGIALHFDFTEQRLFCVEIEQAVRQWPADAEDQFQRFCGLNSPDDAGQHADDTGLLTGCDQTGRRRRLKDTPVAGRLLWNDGRDTAVESQNTDM